MGPGHLQIVTVLVLSSIPELVQGNYRLEVWVHRYSNLDHKRFDGRCCDLPTYDNCGNNPCDTGFFFCLRHPPPSLEASKHETQCPLGNYTTRLIPLGDNEDGDAIDLNRGYIGQHTPNPLVFTGYNWPGAFQLFVRVNDLDQVGSPDLVDIIVTERPLTPSNQFTNVEDVEGQYGYGHLRMNYRITCTGRYGGLNCTTFCGVEGCDLDPCGHTTPCENGATCNNTGPDQYECLCAAGFEGDSCERETNECDPNPCMNGGSCTGMSSGYECQCAAGYIGINCQQIMATNTLPSVDIDRNTSNSTVPGNATEAIIVGAVVGGFLVLLLLVLVVVIIAIFVCCMHTRKEEDETAKLTGHKASKDIYEPGDNPTYAAVEGVHVGIEHSTESVTYHKVDNLIYGSTNIGVSATRPDEPLSQESLGHYSLLRPTSSSPVEAQYSYVVQRGASRISDVSTTDSPAYSEPYESDREESDYEHTP